MMGVLDWLFNKTKQGRTSKVTLTPRSANPQQSKPNTPSTLVGGKYQVRGHWKTAYVSSPGEVTKIEMTPPKEVAEGQFAKVELLVEADSEGYLKFTQCKVSDVATGRTAELSPVQKHAMAKYLANDYAWQLHWQRAPESVRGLFSYSEEPQSCAEHHDWDGCTCRKCGTTRPHEWGDIKEADYSNFFVCDARGEIKREFYKTCKNCSKGEEVRKEYK